MGAFVAMLAGMQIGSGSPPQGVPVPPPALAGAVATRAAPRAPLQNYITPFDRPLSVPRDQWMKVRVKLTIGPYGRITDCMIEQSSGSEALDAATCMTLVRRARFTPAQASDGNPVADVRVQEIEWPPE